MARKPFKPGRAVLVRNAPTPRALTRPPTPAGRSAPLSPPSPFSTMADRSLPPPDAHFLYEKTVHGPAGAPAPGTCKVRKWEGSGFFFRPPRRIVFCVGRPSAHAWGVC